jgi:MFS family permease
MRGGRLTIILCCCLAGGLLPLASFPALVPSFTAEWGLTNTEAGWISGVYYLGYMLSVPLIMSATDRTDARLIFLGGTALSALATFAFAGLVGGFWSAFLWRALAGVGLAGTYMPGLKALTDRNVAVDSSRSVAAYIASFSGGSGLSFLLAGWVADAHGWRPAFAAAALGPLAAMLLSLILLKPQPIPIRQHDSVLRGFRRALGNRAVLGYIIAYGTHNFEAVGMRSWVVSLLAFAAARPGATGSSWSPTEIATTLTLLGVFGTLFGNELAMRIGRNRTIRLIMLESAAVAVLVGAAAGGPYLLLVGLVLLHGMSVTGDAGIIVAGIVQAAAPEVQGASMALQASSGFGASFLGPLVVGVVLDLAGGASSATAWLAAYLTMAVVAALGPLALRLCDASR